MSSKPVSLRGVHVRYKGSERDALAGLTLDVDRGSLLLVTGPNGGGKSTLARLLAGLIPHFYPAAVEGQVRVLGANPVETPDPLLGRVGYVSQDPEAQLVFPTVLDEVAYPVLALGGGAEEARKRALEALSLVGGENLYERTTFELSSGEAQKTILASVLSTSPEILVLDEPLLFLDQESKAQLVNTLRTLKDEGRTIIVVEQELGYFNGLADGLLILRDGRPVDVAERVREAVEEPPAAGMPVAENRPVLEASDVWYRYPRSSYYVVRGFSLSARGGEVHALVGPNGSGKTTILKLLAGIYKPSRGSVERRGRVYYVPQNPLLGIHGPRVIDETRRAHRPGGVEPEAALKAAGLRDLAEEGVARLSHGQLRRLALAAALASGAEIVLMDEPTAGLDPESRVFLERMVRSLVEAGRIVVIATHDAGFLGRVGAETHFLAPKLLNNLN